MVDQTEAAAKQEIADAEAAFNLTTAGKVDEVKPATAEVKTEAPAVEVKADDQDKDAQAKEAAAVEKAEAEAKAEAAAEAKAKAEADTEDEWKGVHPKVRERIEGLGKDLAGVSSLGNEVKRLAGYVSAAQQKVDKALNAIPKTAGAPTKADAAIAALDTESFKVFEKEHGDAWPELVKAVKDGMTVMSETPKAGSLNQDEITQQITATNQKQTLQSMGEIVAIKYPTWEDDAKTPEFLAWFNAQKPEVKALADSPRPRDTIKIFDGYEAHKTAAAETAKAEALRLGAARKRQQGQRDRRAGAEPLRTTPQGYKPSQSEAADAEAEFARVTRSGA